MLAGLKMKVFENPYRVRLIPSEEDRQSLAEYASEVAAFFTQEK